MKVTCLVLLFLPLYLQGQPNCNAFLYAGDSLQYKACKVIEDIDKKYYQFSREYQQAMDEALQICPYFAYAYREKSTAYVKSGDFLTWKKLIDKAVSYAPLQYLGIRASLRYKFFADYAGAIEDIQQLDSLASYDIGSSNNGDYHLNVLKALCHKQLNKKQTAIATLEGQLAKSSHMIGAYDYLHLGVLYLETHQYLKAADTFIKQEKVNNLAENQYYLALVYKQQGERDKINHHLQEAKRLFLTGYRMRDPYNTMLDAIFLENIETELERTSSKP